MIVRAVEDGLTALAKAKAVVTIDQSTRMHSKERKENHMPVAVCLPCAQGSPASGGIRRNGVNWRLPANAKLRDAASADALTA